VIKTLMKKAGELEAELKKEMAQLYLRIKENHLTADQKEKLRKRLTELEKLTNAQQAEVCCGTRFFGRKAASL
jgi:regulator of replication initiation timing